jgi:acrylyl-CoA reductase (NADPH)
MAFAAFKVERDGDAISAGVAEVDEAELGQDPVTIEVAWSALNYKDAMVTEPGNRVARLNPLIPGVDLAGRVVDSADPAVPVGTEVIVHGYDLGVAHHGGFAELARVPSEWVVPLPAGLSAREAMTVGTAGFTAARSLDRLRQGGVGPDSGPILVTGASGGVGSMAVALLAHVGYEVTASTGKADEHAYLRDLGATTVIGREELALDPGRVLGPETWAGAVDCVGGATLGSVLRTLRYGAVVAASGLTGGSGIDTTVFPFIVRNVTLAGVDSVLTPLAERRATWQRIATEFPRRALERIGSVEIGLDGLAGALADLLAAKVRGRVLLRPGS